MNPHSLNDEEVKAKLVLADNLVRRGEIFSAKTRDLEIALIGLCDQRVDQTHLVKEVNKGLLFTHILMERRSQFTNRLVIGLAIIAIIVGIAQVWIALPSKTINDPRDEKSENQKLNPDGDKQKDVNKGNPAANP